MTTTTRRTVWEVPRGYRTPASAYPLGAVGEAALVRRPYDPGHYHMHGVRGRLFYRLRRRHPVTALQVRGQTWMVDDPLHWEATQELVAAARAPRVLVAGLGLGLVVHALAARADVREVVVVEREPDVVRLVEPLLPADDRRTVVVDDFWRYVDRVAPDRFDSIYWDLAVGDGPAAWRSEVGAMYAELEMRFGAHALVQMFGFEGAVRRYRGAFEMLRKAVGS